VDCTEGFYTLLGVQSSCVLQWTVLRNFIHVWGYSLQVYCSGLYWRILYTLGGAFVKCIAVDCTEDTYTRLGVQYTGVQQSTVLKSFIHD
jgi:hypothetical protein